MTVSTIQFITKTRLAELSRQRESLLSQYDAVETAGSGNDIRSLAKLCEGLKSVSISQVALHPELPNLKALFHGIRAPQSLLDFWHEKLHVEIERGRLRANVVYLFGAVLSEWDEADTQVAGRIKERQNEQERILTSLTSPTASPSLEFLNSLLSNFLVYREKIQERLAEWLTFSLDFKFCSTDILPWIATNPNFPQEVRLDAKRFEGDVELRSQLTEAIRVANRDPRQWSWPDRGTSPRVLWTRNRWRLYPTPSLVELLSVNHCGDFWSEAIDGSYTNSALILNRRSRLQKLLDLNAPEVIIANERRMLKMQKERPSLDWYEPVDPWTDQVVLSDNDEEPVRGVVGSRASWQAELREATQLGYGYDEGVNPMVKLVHAEIQLLRAAYPDKPLHVLKLDIRDYFASVPHETLLALLQGLGMSQAGLEFTQRFLKVPYLVDKDLIKPAARGVPMELRYSHWLCEQLMILLERAIHSRSKVRIIRQLDDLCILSPSAQEIVAAYKAAQHFLADVGLSLNDEKCGAVTIGGERSTELPTANPRWGVLELTDSGQWQAGTDAFQKYLIASRQEVDARHAILAKVLVYNDQLKHLTWGLGLAMDLGDQHRRSANASLLAFENDFFGPGQSIFAGIKAQTEERHRGQLDEAPMAWMHWPITAGGLGLRSATVLCGQYQMAYKARRKTRRKAPKDRAENWQTKVNAWSKFYDNMNVKLEPADCAESPTMKALVEGFIRRGKSISGGKQEGLSPYWRWTLSIFGPEILDRLGTFEFLLTDLVPLQLIHDKLLSADTPTTGRD